MFPAAGIFKDLSLEQSSVAAIISMVDETGHNAHLEKRAEDDGEQTPANRGPLINALHSMILFGDRSMASIYALTFVFFAGIHLAVNARIAGTQMHE